MIAFAIFSSISKFILRQHDPVAAAARTTPFYTAGTIGVLVAFISLSGPSQVRFDVTWTLFLALAAALVSWLIIVSRRDIAASSSTERERLAGAEESATAPSGKGGGNAEAAAEKSFTTLMILTACVVSFAHGSNDVSNSIGVFKASR